MPETPTQERKPRKKRTSKAQTKPSGVPLALAEIDKQLSSLIQTIPLINTDINDQSLVLAKETARLNQLRELLNNTKQQINELVGLQRELNGGGTRTPQIEYAFNPARFSTGLEAPQYDPLAPIPPSVGSIPARQPKAGPGNAADDIRNERGFS